jgi:hypothetical protein
VGKFRKCAFSGSGYYGNYEIKSTVRAVSDLQNDIKSLSEFSTRKKMLILQE